MHQNITNGISQPGNWNCFFACRIVVLGLIVKCQAYPAVHAVFSVPSPPVFLGAVPRGQEVCHYPYPFCSFAEDVILKFTWSKHTPKSTQWAKLII